MLFDKKASLPLAEMVMILAEAPEMGRGRREDRDLEDQGMAALQNLLYFRPIPEIVVQQILEYFLNKVKKKQIHISDIKGAGRDLPLLYPGSCFAVHNRWARTYDRPCGRKSFCLHALSGTVILFKFVL